MISGEWGYSTSAKPEPGGPYANVSTQAKYLPRMFLHNMAMGVNLTVWYDWHDDGTDPGNVENNFGIVGPAYSGNVSLPYTPKPAYAAAVAVASHTRACPDYQRTDEIVVSSGQSCFANGTCFNHTVCYAQYWACATNNDASELIAVWCGANDGWSTALDVPVASTAEHDRRERRCWMQSNWLGEVQTIPRCVTFCTTQNAQGCGRARLSVVASNAPTYLRPA